MLILNPPWVKDFCRSARWAARSRARVQRHPDGLLILAALLEREGHTIRFIDGPVAGLDAEAISREIALFSPEVAVLHTTTPSIYNDLSYAERIKAAAPSCVTVALGPHVTALPGETFAISEERFHGALDVVARGEFDLSVKEICAGAASQEIRGISFKDGLRLCHNPERPLLDVNTLPFPAWHLVNPRDYRDFSKRLPFLTLISGRGCHGRCNFCRDTPLMEGRRGRLRNPLLVAEEIGHDLAQFPYIREIMVETDSFTASADHVRNLCESILRRGFHRRLSFACNTRVDMDLSLLPLMKRANFRMFVAGFEFGSQEALNITEKGITLEQSRAFAAETRRLGFTVHGCFMIGAPGETEATARKTIDFAKSLPINTLQFSGICVYPGTKMFRWAKINRFLVPRDWNGWVSDTHEQTTLLNYPQLSRERIDALIDTGLREFYLRPKQILKMLFSIRKLSDVRRLFFGAEKFLDYFRKKASA
ncbi:MAG: radical SAM protein [Fibrobacterota bacterium]